MNVPVHAQVQEITSLLLGLVAQTTPEALPHLRSLLAGLNKLPGALPVLVRVLELMSKTTDKLSPRNWKNAFLVAVSDYTAVKAADEWLSLVPLKLAGGRPKHLSHSDWNLLRERARG